MSFADRITRFPIAYDPAKGAAVAALFADLSPTIVKLIEGTAGCAPYLANLMETEVEWITQALGGAPEEALNDALTQIGTPEPAQLGPTLRRAKRRVALLVALCDLGGLWDLDAVTGALSDLADRALQTAVSTLVGAAQAAGQLPKVDAPDGGLFVLAMGKLGARELNYSSDIDLIFLFDESLYPAEDYQTVRKQFIRITQALVKAFGPGSDGGYVFRTDPRLRPDPSVTPVCIGMGAAERYYEAQGRTWERAAFIRARTAAGDTGAGARFLSDLTPFIWRRHLDFAAIQDAHDMRLRIRDHKGLGGAFYLPGHNVKLGLGGIREIEFFVQTKQLICGGRDRNLRSSRTRPALRDLAAAGWIPEDLAQDLGRAYVAHRTLEHRLQMLDDAQTHIFPKSPEARARLAAFCGHTDIDAFEEAEGARFLRVNTRVERFFSPTPGRGSKGEDPWAALPDPEATQAMVDAWQTLPALKSDRARWLFDRLAPSIAARLNGAADPSYALSKFDSFLRGLPAGVQVFALFEANPQILDLLVDICATAPRLAEYLGRNASALDAVLSPDFFQPLPAPNTLAAELADRLARSPDYEARLDAARIWVREQTFRVGVQLLRQITSPPEAAQGYSAIAEATLQALVPYVIAEVARRHGDPPGAGLAILAMGKLGSAEMTARSDLDLIIVYDAPLDAMSEGARPLATPAWYARFTQTLVAALSAPTAQGALYEVDMRLRPSGRQGPVATSLSGFVRYQREDAWTWEHLALTRARVVAGTPQVVTALNKALQTTLSAPRDPAKVFADVREMRDRLAAKTSVDPWELKAGPGRMLNIELILQMGKVLTPGIAAVAPREMIAPLVEAGWLSAPDGTVLDSTLTHLSAIQQLTRLALEGTYDPGKGGPGLAGLLAKATGQTDVDHLLKTLTDQTEAAAAVIDRLLTTPVG